MRRHAKRSATASFVHQSRLAPAVCGAFAVALATLLGIGAPSALAAAPTFTGLTLARTTQTEAQINARVNPQGSAVTKCEIQYGATTAYGQSAPCLSDYYAEVPFAGAAGTATLPVAAKLAGLGMADVYHYRLVVESSEGEATSADRAFETEGEGENCPTCIGVGGSRRIEVVTAGNKNQNKIGEAIYAADGERVFYSLSGGTPDASFGLPWLAAHRTASGWVSRNALPPNDGSFPVGSAYSSYLWTADLSTWLGRVNVALPGVASPVTVVRLHDDATQEILQTFPSIKEIEISTSPAVVASDDLSKVFFATRQLLDPAHVAGTYNVYELGAGTPELVSRLPDGSVPACGVPLNIGGNGAGFAHDELKSKAGQHWVSTDGSKLFFQAVPSGSCTGARQLYQRDLNSGTTTLVTGPVVAGTDTGLAKPGLLQAAPDGSWVIYKNRSQLDPSDTNTTPDIYRWDAATEANTCLTCAVPGPATAANVPNDMTSAVASEDGSHVYFRSSNQLTPDAPAGTNLYVWRAAEGGTIRFVAPFGSGTISPSQITATELTPDGSVLVFASAAAGVTGDSPAGFVQYFRYDDRDGSVTCVSCSQAPSSVIETLTPLSLLSVAQEHALSTDGDTFVFRSDDRLVAADVNAGADLYEWRDGRLGLLTDGRTPGQTPILAGLSFDSSDPESSVNGRDVFFASAGNTEYGAPDDSQQLYDARIGGGFPTAQAPSAPCSGEACQGVPAGPPAGSGPATSAFSGSGNATQGRKHRKHKHRKRTHHHKHKRANANRRAGR